MKGLKKWLIVVAAVATAGVTLGTAGVLPPVVVPVLSAVLGVLQQVGT